MPAADDEEENPFAALSVTPGGPWLLNRKRKVSTFFFTLGSFHPEHIIS